MAHYDCSNCGESMGIDFGSCSSCTPREYEELVRRRSQIRAEAVHRWETQHAAMIKHFEEWKQRGVEELARESGLEDVDARLHAIQMAHHRSYRNKHKKEGKA